MTYSKGSIGQPIALGSFRVFLHRSLSTHTVFRTDKYELVISVSTRCPHLVGRTTLTPFFTRFPPICKADADDVIGYRFSVRTDLESFDNLPVFRFTSHPASYPQDKLPSIEWNAVEVQDMRGYRDVYVMFEVSESVSTPTPAGHFVLIPLSLRTEAV